MKDREIICKYYTCAGGLCSKRGISVYFKDECQKCKYYIKKAGAAPRRTDNRKQKMNKIQKREMRNYD